jgi:single-strand DNA-binding protein
MPNLSQVQLVGHVGNNAEFKSFDSYSVLDFSLAVTPYEKDEEKKETIWFKITKWNPPDFMTQGFISKGSAVLVIGTLKMERYTDKTGVEREKLKVIAQDIVMINRKRTEKGEDTAVTADQLANAGAQTQKKGQTAAPVIEDDDDLPF